MSIAAFRATILVRTLFSSGCTGLIYSHPIDRKQLQGKGKKVINFGTSQMNSRTLQPQGAKSMKNNPQLHLWTFHPRLPPSIPLHPRNLLPKLLSNTTPVASSPNVTLISECFVKPKYYVEEADNPVYLAPWDLTWLSIHYIQKGLLFAKSPLDKLANPIEPLLVRLRDSLSLALVHFYSLAGQFVTEVDEDEHTSLIFIDSKKGPGVRFIHAALDTTISDILSPTDVPRVVQSLFDHHKAINHDGHSMPLLSVQVTELNDGVFLGCSINHVCADGASYWHFLSTWSEIFKAQGDQNTPISRPPIQQRWFIDDSGPMIRLPFTHKDEFIAKFEAQPHRERIFHFSTESIALLKAKANADSGTNKVSSFQALSALVWRCITRARHVPHDKITHCNIPTNERGRLNPPLPQDYFGNSVQWIRVRTTSGELLGQTLGHTATLLNEAMAAHDDTMARMMVKGWMKSPVIYHMGAYYDPYSIVFGGSPRFDMYGNEFGMGRAIAVLTGYGNKFDGKVTSSPGRDGGGSVDLEVCLSHGSMAALESDEEFMAAVSVLNLDRLI